MTKKTNPVESKMLRQVRRWRREAYEAEQFHSQSERARRLRELADHYGLRTTATERPPLRKAH